MLLLKIKNKQKIVYFYDYSQLGFMLSIEVAILILDHPTLRESFSLLTSVGILGREFCWGNPFGRYEYPLAHHYT